MRPQAPPALVAAPRAWGSDLAFAEPAFARYAASVRARSSGPGVAGGAVAGMDENEMFADGGLWGKLHAVALAARFRVAVEVMLCGGCIFPSVEP